MTVIEKAKSEGWHKLAFSALIGGAIMAIFMAGQSTEKINSLETQIPLIQQAFVDIGSIKTSITHINTEIANLNTEISNLRNKTTNKGAMNEHP